MSLHQTSDETEGGTEESELVKCILDLFNHLSIERLHKIAFIIESRYYAETGSRMTSADYIPTLDGVYSDEIQNVIDGLNGIDRREVNIRGDVVSTIEVNSGFDCNCEESDLIQDVASDYGEISPSEMNSVLRSHQSYEETPIGREIKFEEVTAESE